MLSSICRHAPSSRALMVQGRVHSAPRIRTFFNILSQGPNFEKPQTYTVKMRVNVTPKEMFDVVSDVSKYSSFVPFVEESFINTRDDRSGLPKEGGLRVGWKQFDERFTCNLRCEKDKQVIAESVTAPLFEELFTEWNFKELKGVNNTSCEVELNLKYRFKNPVYNTLSSLFSDQVSQVMTKAFRERALELKLERMMQKKI